jgi:hypothetical protein
MKGARIAFSSVFFRQGRAKSDNITQWDLSRIAVLEDLHASCSRCENPPIKDIHIFPQMIL